MRFLPVSKRLLKSITLDTPIDDLPVSARVHNCLKGEGFTTVRDLTERPDCDFYRIPNMGRVSINLLANLLIEAGITTHLRRPEHRYVVPFFYQQKIDRNREIWKSRASEGESVASLARRFKLCQQTIRIILARGEREAAQLARLQQKQKATDAATVTNRL